jgi:hypothetical protein
METGGGSKEPFDKLRAGRGQGPAYAPKVTARQGRAKNKKRETRSEDPFGLSAIA